MKPKLLLLIINLVFISSVNAQIKGCTDKKANNYNINAEINDGSCTYDQTSYTPKQICFDLSDSISETSGLIYYNGLFWTINDSNNPPILYAFDSINGRILHQTFIKNQTNDDWEELTQDSLFIYIGDFGNNSGGRKNLNILKIKKSSLNLQVFSDTVEAEKIRFAMQDQSNFNNSGQNHDYDLEAFCVLADSLHLFSKNWVDGKTRHYICPTDSGFYNLMPVETLNPGGQITGAAYDGKGCIVLSGYNKGTYACFIYLLWDYKNQRFSNGNKRRIETGNALFPGQNEAVCFVNQSVYMSSEKQISNAQLFRLQVAQWTADANSSAIPLLLSDVIINVDVIERKLILSCQEKHLNQFLQVYDSSGRVVQRIQLKNLSETFDLNSYADGIYYIFSDQTLLHTFMLN